MVVVLEGACGAGKTTLAAALCEVARSRGLALHSVGQRYTYGLVAGLEDLGQLDDGIVRVLLGRAVAAIRECGGDQVVDTLHVTQFVRLGMLSRASFDAVDAELAEIDARIVFVRVSERALWKRVVEGRRGTGFRTYAAKFGESDEALHDWLCREQGQIAETVRVDATASADPIAHRVAKHLQLRLAPTIATYLTAEVTGLDPFR